jgi:hypothetical protein
MNLYVIKVVQDNSKYNGYYVNKQKDDYTSDIEQAFKAKTFQAAKRQLQESYEMIVPLDDIKG